MELPSPPSQDEIAVILLHDGFDAGEVPLVGFERGPHERRHRQFLSENRPVMIGDRQGTAIAGRTWHTKTAFSKGVKLDW